MRQISLDRLGAPECAGLKAPFAPAASIASRPLADRPMPARRARSSTPARYYVGRRPSRSEVYVVSRTELEPLAHLRYRSDAPFDWGSFSEGAVELAFAILAHTTESRPTELVCQAFCGEVVACLDPAGFVLSYGEIALWLLTAFGDGDASPDEPAPGRPGGLHRRAANRIRSWLRRT